MNSDNLSIRKTKGNPWVSLEFSVLLKWGFKAKDIFTLLDSSPKRTNAREKQTGEDFWCKTGSILFHRVPSSQGTEARSFHTDHLLEGDRVGTDMDPAADNPEGGRERDRKPFRRHFTKNSSTFIFVSIDARILYSHANTAVAVWPYPGLQAIPTNTAN